MSQKLAKFAAALAFSGALIVPLSATAATSTVAGCAVGNLFSTTTGAPCTATSTVPGCLPGYRFSPLTDAACPATPATSCVDLTHNLSFGKTDATTAGEVTKLQDFFAAGGYMNTATGYFGPLTEAAVQHWQSSQGIVSSGSPATTGYGSVGPRSRAALTKCSVTTQVNTTIPTSTLSYAYSYGGGGNIPAPTVTISVSPISVTSGGSSTLTWSSTNATSCTGAGFTASATSGGVTVTPAITATYTLTCTGAGGSASQSAMVTIAPSVTTTCPFGWICPATPILSHSTKIGAWYTPFWQAPGTTPDPYDQHWSQWTEYEPLLGYYSSGATSTVTVEFAEMKAAGIDYAILDDTNGVWADHGYIEQNVQNIFAVDSQLPSSSQLPLSFAIGNGLVTRSLAAQNDQANFIWDNYAQQPVYFTWQEKPLLVNYNAYDNNQNVYAPNWSDARYTVRPATGDVVATNPLLAPYSADGFWGWVQEYPQLTTSEEVGVTPGWDRSHLGAAAITTKPRIDRVGGTYYENEWLQAIQAHPQTIVISSWNDFGEETAIEPAVSMGDPEWTDSYGTQVPDWYVQITTAYANLRTGLMQRAYYQDEGDINVYLVNQGQLVYQGAMPHGHPVITLPAGTLTAYIPTPHR